jgi:WD40 repeat protein
MSVAFGGDGRLLASGGEDFSIKLWDVTTGKAKATTREDREAGHVWCVAFAPEDTLLAAARYDGTVQLWDVAAVLKAGK